MGHIPPLRFTDMGRALLVAHKEVPGVTPGEQTTKQKLNRNTTKKSPHTKDLWPGMTLGNNKPVPVPTRTSAIKTAATKEKHRQLAHTQCTVNRERATQPNATQTPPPEVGESWEGLERPRKSFFPPSYSGQREDYPGPRSEVPEAVSLPRVSPFQRQLWVTQSSHPHSNARPELEDPVPVPFICFCLVLKEMCL